MPTPHEFALMARGAYHSKPEKLPKGWVLLERLIKDEDGGYKGFSAAAYINQEKTEIVIAFRGTELTATPLTKNANLRSDFILFLGTMPETLIFAQEFFHKINQKYTNATIYFTGHSLGAVHAELMGLKHRKLTVSFDSPGTENLVRGSEVYDQDFDQYITTYLAAPHIINTLNGHVGKVYRLMVPHVEGFRWQHGAACLWGTAMRAISIFSAGGSYLGKATTATLGLFRQTATRQAATRSAALVSAYAAGKTGQALGAGVVAEKLISGGVGAAALVVSFYDTSSWTMRQHSIDNIISVFNPETGQPYNDLVEEVIAWPKLWPPQTTRNWIADELLGFVPFLDRNRGLHTLLRENVVLEAQITSMVGFEIKKAVDEAPRMMARL